MDINAYALIGIGFFETHFNRAQPFFLRWRVAPMRHSGIRGVSRPRNIVFRDQIVLVQHCANVQCLICLKPDKHQFQNLKFISSEILAPAQQTTAFK
jgi:hypothetical protein